MDAPHRKLFNDAFSDSFFENFMKAFTADVGPVPFRVAETPFLMTVPYRDLLCKHATEIIAQLCVPEKLDLLKKAIPANYSVAGMDELPNCVQVDFAVTQNQDGSFDGKVVELQAFPSLYALMPVMSDHWAKQMNTIQGLKNDWSWAIQMSQGDAIELMRKTILGHNTAEETVLVDITPELQKTVPDFVATKNIFDVDSVCITKIIKEGNKLFRMKDGKKLQIKRIYNRIVFDELEVKGITPPFAWGDDLEITWCSHPNWYWVWSKFSLPHIHHSAVPKAQYLSELKSIPTDLENYVLKPLFSFAGSGVKVDVTKEDIDAVPQEQKSGWVLQEKIQYADAIKMPDGNGVKAEVRVMFARPPDAKELTPVICLVRLSRGKMLGVDFNKGLTWVGGSVGMWAL